MSQEYLVHFSSKITDEIIAEVIRSINEKISLSVVSDDGKSLWIPSSNPLWIDFSIEENEGGLFVVSNLNGCENSEIFSLIEKTLGSHGVAYVIEDV